MATINAVDDGGAVRGRVFRMTGGDRFALVQIGGIDLTVDGYDDAAAERCQAIASEFHRMALELLLPARELSGAEAGDAAGEALSNRARALEARQAPAGEGPKS